MKIAVVVDTWFPYLGGGQINAVEISKRIARKNIKVDIITRNNGPDNLKKIRNLQVIKLGTKSNPLDQLSKLFFLARATALILKSDYDLIHLHAFLPGLVTPFLKLAGKKVIFTVHGTSLGTEMNNGIKKWLENLILTKIKYDKEITVSKDFFKHKNVNKKIAYVPNGVDVSFFDKAADKEKKFDLIFVGRLHPQKNLASLINSIDYLKKDYPDIKLIIVGAGLEKKKLQRFIRKLKLSKNVILKDEVQGKHLIALYKSSKLFVLPSIYEGFPLSMLEAWAAKLPVIVSKTGDCQYLVKDGLNGYLIKNQRNPGEIAETVKRALRNKSLNKLGENGYDLVKTNFSWDKSAQKTLNLYKQIMQ